MVTKKSRLLSAASALALGAAVPAHAITIDGHASDWGITLVNGGNTAAGGSIYTPGLPSYGGAGTTGLLGGTNPRIEDTNDTAGIGGQVGPWQGGQKYDAQYMAVALTTPVNGSLLNSTISILISSGQRPANGLNNFGMGDIRLDGLTGHYGIETGGAAGHTGGPAIDIQTQASAGRTYTLNGNGVTTSSATAPIGTAGTIFKTSSNVGNARDPAKWILDPLLNDNGGAANPAAEQDDRSQLNYALLTAADIVLANVAYRYTADALYADGSLPSDHGGTPCDPAASSGPTQCSVHSLIELSFDAAPFVIIDPDGTQRLVFSIDWGPSCNNDVLEASVYYVGLFEQVPEPTTISLLATGILGFGASAWRRARRAASASASRPPTP